MVLISQAFCRVLKIRKVILYLLNILSTPVKSFIFRSVNSSEQIRETVRTRPNAHSPQPLPPSPSGRIPIPAGPGKSASPRRRAEVHMTRRWQLPPYPQTLCPGRAMGFCHIPAPPRPPGPLPQSLQAHTSSWLYLLTAEPPANSTQTQTESPGDLNHRKLVGGSWGTKKSWEKASRSKQRGKEGARATVDDPGYN